MEKSALEHAYDAESFRKLGHELIDLLADRLGSVGAGKGGVLHFRLPETERLFWEEYLHDPQAPSLAETVLAHTTHVQHPRYMGHQVAPPLPLASLAALLGASLNNGMAVYEMGMAPSAMERIVTDWLCQKAGYGQQARGFLTSGGTLANLTALLAARRARGRGDVWNEGYSGRQAILVSEAAHYCIDRAARIMGMGEAGVLKVPVDAAYRMDADQLPVLYERALEQGLEPLAVVGSAPCTATGSYDPLDRLATFCQEKNLWLHVDGAHGGAAFLSERYRSLVRGLERADSVAIDGHKMLGMPVLTTALLFRNGADSYTTFSQEAEYLLTQTDEEDWYNLAKRTFECTKLTSSLTWFAVLKAYGEEIFSEYIDRQFDLGRQLASLVRNRPGWELACEPQSNILCFRVRPEGWDTDACNALNGQIRQQLLEAGRFYIVQTKLNGILYLRTSLMSPFTEERHLVELLDTVEALAGGDPPPSHPLSK